MTQFYGFDWQQAPSYSRLFSPNVMQRAQSAYGQGMGQFTAYDPAQLEKLRAAQQEKLAAAQAANAAKNPTIAGNFIVGPDGRVYDSSDKLGLLRQYRKLNPTTPQSREGGSIAGLNRYYKGAIGIEDLVKQYGFKPLTGG